MLLDMEKVHRLQSNVKIGMGHARKMLAATVSSVVQEANAPYLSMEGEARGLGQEGVSKHRRKTVPAGQHVAAESSHRPLSDDS